MLFNHSTVHPLSAPLMQLYLGVVYLIFSILLLLFDVYIEIETLLLLLIPAVTVGMILLVLIKRKYHIPREKNQFKPIQYLFFALLGVAFAWGWLEFYQRFEFARMEYSPIFFAYLVGSGMMTVMYGTRTMPVLFFILLIAVCLFSLFPDYGTPQMVEMFFLVFGLLYFSTGAWEFRDKLSKIKQAE